MTLNPELSPEKRKTSKKKFRAKLAEHKAWLKKERSRSKAGAILRTAKRKLEGHLQYYAITDNGPMCSAFRYQLVQLLFKWLNRRSQRRSYTWERFNQALAWVGMPRVRVYHDLNPCRVGPE